MSANPEKIGSRKSELLKYKGDLKGYYRETSKRWRKNHPEKIMAKSHNRRASELLTPPNQRVTTEEIKDLLDKAICCAICKKPFNAKLKKTIDHIKPLSKKGTHNKKNLQIVCKGCNSRKGAKIGELK